MPMDLARLIAGGLALLFGRQLFWLFVGVVGFIIGMEIATRAYWGHPEPAVLIIALAAGVVGAVLAYVLQETMIAVVGFVAGGYVATMTLATVMPHPGRNLWLALLIGGLIGAVLLMSVFHWALIVLSSLFGASAVVEALHVGPDIAPVVFVALVVAGIVAQASLMRRRPPSVA